MIKFRTGAIDARRGHCVIPDAMHRTRVETCLINRNDSEMTQKVASQDEQSDEKSSRQKVSIGGKPARIMNPASAGVLNLAYGLRCSVPRWR